MFVLDNDTLAILRKDYASKVYAVSVKITLLVIVDYSPHKLRSIGSLIEGQRWVKSLKTPHFWQSKCSEIYTVDVCWKSVNVVQSFINNTTSLS